jgi:cytochrome c553
MKTQFSWLWGFGLVAIVSVIVLSVSEAAAQAPKGPGTTPVQRGRYLVDITGCHDCHTPKKDAQGHIDETRLLSGRPSTTSMPSAMAGEIHTALDLTAWTGPWGATNSSNLTPDAKTGLPARKYTEASFIAMFRTGKKPSGVAVLPPMPYEMYANMTDNDLKAIWAYLQSIKPIANQVPPNAPAPPPKK